VKGGPARLRRELIRRRLSPEALPAAAALVVELDESERRAVALVGNIDASLSGGRRTSRGGRNPYSRAEFCADTRGRGPQPGWNWLPSGSQHDEPREIDTNRRVFR
jgi:hypothetical protein